MNTPFNWQAGTWARQSAETAQYEVCIASDWAPIRAFSQPILDNPEAVYGNLLDELRSSVPDLMLLDVILPDTSGWELLECLQEDERARDIPVVFVSAQDLASRPLRTGFLLAAMGEGLSIQKLLRFSLGFSRLMFEPP